MPLAEVKAHLLATLAVLSDAHAVADLREAAASRVDGEIYSTEDVLADFTARRSQSA
ncbi:MAG TPA: hypothetical protein VLJ59_15015 [Mycobacteriales bacterium]|nr:hypothetical protein [Mycobacteriales bacterium]